MNLDADGLETAYASTSLRCPDTNEEMQEQKVEVMDIEEKIVNDTEINVKQEFLDEYEKQELNSISYCKIEMKTEDESNFEEYDSNCSPYNSEDMKLEVQPDDDKIIFNREEFLNKTKNDHSEIKTQEYEELQIKPVSIHKNPKKHHCSMCEFTTPKKGNLTHHIESVHLKIRKHCCTECEFATFRKLDLARHVKAVHLKIKNHFCSMCDFASTRKIHLTSHIQTVHLKIKKHHCSVCSYATCSKSNVKRHMESFHSEINKG